MTTPTVKSYEQILGEMIATYFGKISIDDLNTGSVVLSFFESMAQAIYRASGDVFSILRDYSVDRAESERLQKIAADENIKILTAKVATGKVIINDTSFTKTATKIYAGGTAPNIGSNSISVSDASDFPTTGSIYIGRGTNNIEGPIDYTSITTIGSYYIINLSTSTTKYHNLSETVILAQGGNRTIASGTVVKTKASGSANVINFTTTKSAILLDGESEIINVPVAAQEPGQDGNVPRGAIQEFASEPFSGATVTNPLPFTTGRNKETDEELKAHIKRERASKGLGTATAVKNSVLNAQASDENKTILSSEIVTDTDETDLFIDDGTGYEETTKGVAQEFIIDSAIGGEKRFQLVSGGSQTSIAKAFLESFNESPFSVYVGDKLAILVGGVLSEHTFATDDFQSDGYATAYEIVASINADSDIEFNARTSNDGTKVVISAISESNEYLQVVTPTSGTDAALSLGFPTNEIQTLRIYKNRQALNRNGRTARLFSADQNDWSVAITTGDTLTITVDNTTSVTYTFTDADFISEGTYITVSNTNSLDSWINVINSKVIGITATISGNQIILSSNLGANSRSSVVIDSSASTLVTKGMFTSALGLSSTGQASDYTLSRNTGQLKLVTALNAGDSLSAGSEYTCGEISTDAIVGGSLILASDAYLWFLIDNQDAEIISHGVVSDTVFHFTKTGSPVVRFRSSVANAFSNLVVGDYVIMWSTELNAANRLEGRVSSIGTHTLADDYFELTITPAEYAACSDQLTVTFDEGLVVLRTDTTPQKITIPAASYDINTISDILDSSIYGATSRTENDEVIIVTTKTQTDNGSVFLVAANADGQTILFTVGESSNSVLSHFAIRKSQNVLGEFPLFIHDKINSDESADPSASYISSFDSVSDLSSLLRPNVLICFLNSFGGYDTQPVNECVQVSSIAGTTIGTQSDELIKRLRVNDRFFAASPYDFTYNDNLIVVLDNDASNESFSIPMYRRAVANTTIGVNATDFRAYDVDSGATETFDTYFGVDFDFANYKVLMRARNVLDPISLTDEDAILYRATDWGISGERYNIGYIYPTGSDNELSHTVLVSDVIPIRISLKSGPVVPSSIDGTTEWVTSITPNTPVAGMEEVTYSWTGVGTDPAMITLVAGNYVTIGSNSGFQSLNIGTFRISSATATTFTVRRPSGSATVETATTLESNAINLYEDSDTTASEIVDYVNANISNFITAELVDDNGTSGAGIIDLSTYEDNEFVSGTESISLVDGFNFISVSNVDAVAPLPNFIFKTALSLPNFDTNTLNTYTFNNGEEIRLVPTTPEQVANFIAILAVSGITTVGDVDTSDRLKLLQISSQILGSSGSVQISGGTANKAVAAMISASLDINDDFMLSQINRSAVSGFHAEQWVKLEASNIQKKNNGINATTDVTIQSYNSTPSLITLDNRRNQDRFFGQPRNNIREIGRTFYVEKQGSLVCLTWDGSGTTPYFSKSVEFNDDEDDIVISYDPLTGYTSYVIDGGIRNFNEVQPGDIITIAVGTFADDSNNGTFKVVGVSDDGLTLVTNNTNGVTALAETIAIGEITIATEVSEGDSVKISSPFNILNQGVFRVIRRYGDSIYIDNPLAVEEAVTITDNLRGLGFDGTTEFDITLPGDMRIEWNGTGTQPTLDNAKLGDIITLGSAFDADNQGSFMVTNVSSGYNEQAYIKCVPASSITTGQSFTFDLPNTGTGYYVWYNKDGGGGDPAIGGRTGIEVVVTTGDTDDTVCEATRVATTAIAGITSVKSALMDPSYFVAYSIVQDDNSFLLVCDTLGDALDAANVDVGGTFTITKLNDGAFPYIECANSKVVVESGIVVSGAGADILECQIPSLLFNNYDNVIEGDDFVISGDVLGSSNTGTYTVYEVLNKNQLLINEIMTDAVATTLFTQYTQVYAQEIELYTGYKKIYLTATNPSNSNRSYVVFDSSEQFDKINLSAGVSMSAICKLNFLESIVSGLDSYRYHTGLIAEANRIVYGEPRDPITYPGVAAAGAEIFIKSAPIKRIQVSINVRVQTGTAFNQIVEQVKNNVAALINSSPSGQSIAISDIIAVVNIVPGVTAVSINSPAYSATSDVIVVNPSEKPRILDIARDITVSKV